MGPVVTINSATLVNKGLEVIEAHLLFGMSFDRIEVVVHPTSVVHSMVEFFDGSTIAQAVPADDADPDRARSGLARATSPTRRPAVDWTRRSGGSSSPSTTRPSPQSPKPVAPGTLGGTAPAVYNAANEVCVQAFRDGRTPSLDIVDTVAAALGRASKMPSTCHRRRTLRRGSLTVDDVLAADAWAREEPRRTCLLNRSE
jgi:1-deoxy-D-xylulose-5-phosphate reductoisomerase